MHSGGRRLPVLWRKPVTQRAFAANLPAVRGVDHRFLWSARLRSSPFPRRPQESSRQAKKRRFSSTGFNLMPHSFGILEGMLSGRPRPRGSLWTCLSLMGQARLLHTKADVASPAVRGDRPATKLGGIRLQPVLASFFKRYPPAAAPGGFLRTR